MPNPTRLNRHDTGLAPSKPLTTTAGDALLDKLLGERRFQDAPVRSLGGRLCRPEPLAIPGGGSSITGTGGGGIGHRRGHHGNP